MSTISAAAVNELRKRTDMPLMECKKALTEAGGDLNKAADLLRSWNKNVGIKRAMNETAEGRVGVYIDPATENAAIIEMRCESAPVTKSEQFIGLVNLLARTVAETNPETLDGFLAAKTAAGTVQDSINEVIGLIRENMKVYQYRRLSGGTFGEYIHHDGTLGVLIQLKGKGGSAEVLRDICAHIAAMNPLYAKPEDVPAAVMAKEKEIVLEQMKTDPKNVGKPANILEKIVEGKLKTWGGENVLLEQLIANQAKYDKKTVGQLIKAAGLELVGYVRYKVGEVAVK